MGQKGILLRFVEAMNLVDEDDGARAVLAGAVGIAHDLLDFLDAGEHGGKLDEVGLGDAGDDLGERGLAGPGRAPEDHRGGIVALDLHAQRLAGPDEMLLADEFIERARTHAVGERDARLRRRDLESFRRDGREEIHIRSEVRGQIAEVKVSRRIHADSPIKVSDLCNLTISPLTSLRLHTARCWPRLRR